MGEDQTKNKFLRYKKYARFQADLREDKISQNSIVFIEDVSRIWARGKEYICKGITLEGSKIIGDNFDLEIDINNSTISLINHTAHTVTSLELATKREINAANAAIAALRTNITNINNRIDNINDVTPRLSEIEINLQNEIGAR